MTPPVWVPLNRSQDGRCGVGVGPARLAGSGAVGGIASAEYTARAEMRMAGGGGGGGGWGERVRERGETTLEVMGECCGTEAKRRTVAMAMKPAWGRRSEREPPGLARVQEKRLRFCSERDSGRTKR